MPILSLQNVSKEYSTDGQPVRALDGVSLDVEAGQFVALGRTKRMREIDAAEFGGGDGFSDGGECAVGWRGDFVAA